METIESAILAAYRKDFGLDEELEYEVELDPKTGAAKIYQFAKGKKKEKEEITPPGFGRIAAQTAKQVILQKIREAEKTAILEEYEERVNQLVNGIILRFDGQDIICNVGRGQARMPLEEQVRSEDYRLNKRFTFYIKEIQEGSKGRQIIVSRAAEELVALLFKREVPEVSSGAVEIKKVAREPGRRTKIAVVSTQSGVDPVGSCVGQKGIRVQAVIDELEGEKIDIIQYSDDEVKLIIAALSPAENLEIKINQKKKTASVTAPEEQLSLAIGKEGQNVRLAAKLTGYKIDIQGSEKNQSKTGSSRAEKKTKKAATKQAKAKPAKNAKKKSAKNAKGKTKKNPPKAHPPRAGNKK